MWFVSAAVMISTCRGYYCRVETRTLEIERREDLRQRATAYLNELHQHLQELQSSNELYKTGQYCEELLRDTISMIFDNCEGS